MIEHSCIISGTHDIIVSMHMYACIIVSIATVSVSESRTNKHDPPSLAWTAPLCLGHHPQKVLHCLCHRRDSR